MTATEITDRREITLRNHGFVTINEFDGGERILLAVNTPTVSFHLHLSAEEWAEFQQAVAS